MLDSCRQLEADVDFSYMLPVKIQIWLIQLAA